MTTREVSDAMYGETGEHDHVWGPIEHAHFTGNPHRKCQVSDCRWITLDPYDDDGGDE